MAQPFLDDFTEASNTNLEDHTPSGGTAWTLTGTAAAAIINAATDALRSRTTSVSYYVCDDQGSADQYVEVRLKNLSAFPDSYVTCRLVDASNFIGWRLVGTGSSGSRLTKMVAGFAYDLITHQGVDEAVYRVEVSGSTAKLFEDGVQVDVDQTYSENTTETSQGLLIGSNVTVDWIDDFEAGALGGGSTPVTIDLTAASLGFTAQSVQLALAMSLSAPSLGFTANSTQSALSTPLATGSLGFTAGEVQPSVAVNLTEATMSFVGEAIQNNLAIILSAAALAFTAYAIDVTGAVASVVARTLMLLGVGS